MCVITRMRPHLKISEGISVVSFIITSPTHSPLQRPRPSASSGGASTRSTSTSAAQGKKMTNSINSFINHFIHPPRTPHHPTPMPANASRAAASARGSCWSPNAWRASSGRCSAAPRTRPSPSSAASGRTTGTRAFLSWCYGGIFCLKIEACRVKRSFKSMPPPPNTKTKPVPKQIRRAEGVRAGRLGRGGAALDCARAQVHPEGPLPLAEPLGAPA